MNLLSRNVLQPKCTVELNQVLVE